jgi:hypothetical protein
MYQTVKSFPVCVLAAIKGRFFTVHFRVFYFLPLEIKITEKSIVVLRGCKSWAFAYENNTELRIHEPKGREVKLGYVLRASPDNIRMLNSRKIFYIY